MTATSTLTSDANSILPLQSPTIDFPSPPAYNLRPNRSTTMKKTVTKPSSINTTSLMTTHHHQQPISAHVCASHSATNVNTPLFKVDDIHDYTDTPGTPQTLFESPSTIITPDGQDPSNLIHPDLSISCNSWDDVDITMAGETQVNDTIDINMSSKGMNTSDIDIDPMRHHVKYADSYSVENVTELSEDNVINVTAGGFGTVFKPPGVNMAALSLPSNMYQRVHYFAAIHDDELAASPTLSSCNPHTLSHPLPSSLETSTTANMPNVISTFGHGGVHQNQLDAALLHNAQVSSNIINNMATFYNNYLQNMYSTATLMNSLPLPTYPTTINNASTYLYPPQIGASFPLSANYYNAYGHNFYLNDDNLSTISPSISTSTLVDNPFDQTYHENMDRLHQNLDNINIPSHPSVSTNAQERTVDSWNSVFSEVDASSYTVTNNPSTHSSTSSTASINSSRTASTNPEPSSKSKYESTSSFWDDIVGIDTVHDVPVSEPITYTTLRQSNKNTASKDAAITSLLLPEPSTISDAFGIPSGVTTSSQITAGQDDTTSNNISGKLEDASSNQVVVVPKRRLRGKKSGNRYYCVWSGCDKSFTTSLSMMLLRPLTRNLSSLLSRGERATIVRIMTLLFINGILCAIYVNLKLDTEIYAKETIRQFLLAYSLWNIIAISGFLYVLYIRQSSIQILPVWLRVVLILNMVGMILLKTVRYCMYYPKYYYPGKYTYDFDTAQTNIDYAQEAWLALIILIFECLYFSQIQRSQTLLDLYTANPIGRDLKMILIALIASDALDLKEDVSLFKKGMSSGGDRTSGTISLSRNSSIKRKLSVNADV
ncbi:hypothetical protein HDU76_001763 [Blyttiomyces sp. JEL0837]|nr:hypothetical protein HDU76_001763 [Blyttiomyces sp. JEL0837]